MPKLVLELVLLRLVSIELDIEGARPGNLSNKPTYSVPYATRAHVGRVVIYVCVSTCTQTTGSSQCPLRQSLSHANGIHVACFSRHAISTIQMRDAWKSNSNQSNGNPFGLPRNSNSSNAARSLNSRH